MAIIAEMTSKILFLGSPLFLVALISGFFVKYELLGALKRPIDLGMSFRGKRIFGEHKTWRGCLINIFGCTLGTSIQALLQNEGLLPCWIFMVDYENNHYKIGFLMGIGMTVGELPNSFLKRQKGVAPGEKSKGFLRVIFFLFDQVDLAIGIWLFILPIIKPSMLLFAWSFVVTVFFHISVSALGYILRLRQTIA